MPFAIKHFEYGPPEVLRYVEVDPLVPGPGQVLVETRAIGVNPGDTKRRQGGREGTTFPIVPGADAAGVVAAVGKGVEGFAPGDEVIGRKLSGSYAEQVLAAPVHLFHKPRSLTFEQATVLGSPAGTAYQVLRSLHVGPGDVLLVHAGAGGVGQSAIQFARYLGARVVATASPTNHDRLRALGAVPVAYGEGLTDRVRAAAPDGVTVALDAIGTDEALATSLELVADPLRIGTVAAVARAEELGIRGYSGPNVNEIENRWRSDATLLGAELHARGEFDIEVAARYPLSRAADAHRHSETRHVRGKIVLVPDALLA